MEVADVDPIRVLFVTGRRQSGAPAEGLEGERSNLSTVTARTVPDALDRLDESVDAVVSRYRLADDSDGIDLLEAVRERRPHFPFFLVTAAGDESLAAEATAHDVTEYVPDHPDGVTGYVTDRIDEAVARYRERRDPPKVETVSRKAPHSPPSYLEQYDDEWKAAVLDTIFERLPAHLFVKNEAARHVLVSSGFIDDPDGFIGKTDVEMGATGAEQTRKDYEDDLHVIKTGEPILDRERYYPETDHWTLTSKVPWRDSTGDIVGLLGVSYDITERKKSRERVKRQNERLDRFASVLSHDLRGPINVAAGHVELFQETGKESHIDEIEAAITQIDERIDNVLSLARHGQVVIETEVVDLATVAREAWQVAGATEASLSVGPETPDVRADRSRLQQLLENLFRNSVDHAGESASVSLGRADETGFFVADDGPGVPKNEQDDIFEIGYTDAADGTGIGLAVVQEIVEAHDWTIDVTDSDAGGARFEIRGVDEA